MQLRDQVIAVLLVEHRVLTTSQLAAVLFPSVSAARTRLYRLRGKGWVTSFTPVRASGRVETHWSAGLLAARYVAARDGESAPTPRAWRERCEAIAVSAHLAHTVGANQVFVDLLAHARTYPGARLARWWGPARTASAHARRVFPDGHGVWTEPGPEGGERQVGFWLEYDTGTEALHRLVAKIDPYARLRQTGGPDYPVLFVLPNRTRQTNFHHLLRQVPGPLGVTIATTSWDAGDPDRHGLTGAVWQLASTSAVGGNDPCRLIDLPHTPGHPGPYHPGPPTPDQDPLTLLNAHA